MLKLFLLLALPLLAQEQGGDYPQAPVRSGGPSAAGPAQGPASQAPQEEPPAPKEEAAGPLSMEDARLNFASVVETFIGQRSPDGFWPLKDKVSGRKRRLKLESIDETKITTARTGASHFTGPVILTDLADGNRPLRADFTVDLSGSQWKVVGMKLSQPAPSPERKGSARTKPRPESPEQPD